MTQLYQSERKRFEERGQGQVFAHAASLDSVGQEKLCADTQLIDLDEIESLVDTLVRNHGTEAISFEGLEPAPYISHPVHGGDKAEWDRARASGEAALRAGKVAAFTVAGGQGTRLGYDGPKGTFPVTPIRKRPLFQVFAEKLLAAGNRYGVAIPWYIMTSSINHEATVQAFEEAGFFGLERDQVKFFSQGRMPAVDFEGKILLSGKDTVAMSPDGHGGSLRALVRSGAIADMKERGIEAISYFQVDNPLVQVIDPAFIGFHMDHGSEMSSKMIPKAYPGEKVGHFCVQNGRTLVVEYSDMPEAMQEERDSSGQLRFLSGSIAIHILDVGFVERIGGGKAGVGLPFHRADKKIQTVDADGNVIAPDKPNGVKFEMFVFDALPFASNPVIIETLREDDFSPVKNASGIDSAESCRDDQLRQWTRWLKAAGIVLPADSSGLPEIVFEISPLFADSEQAFLEKWSAIADKPEIVAGTVLA
ncbi:UDPGP type 1 family protein [Puniceicoccales bacterium CK1056]|uniref:UDPGP type 1 family protein n=1 Tax=Oceanipulchritudo coccoides TaxID=2706888 RepID=A0A6B2M1U2_9BACT|nr:UDPGP type 1 family protein [Oceanipulchritudo coccoides]NDV62693.1 UDPGP type 1 family protein [Oceanipulchritudo coccoides]